MIQEREIRDRLRAFLRNDISQEDFRSWLTGSSWNMHRDSSDAARRRVGAIELAFAEYLAGDRSTAELRGFFENLLRPTESIEVELSPDPASLLLRVRPISSVPLGDLVLA